MMPLSVMAPLLQLYRFSPKVRTDVIDGFADWIEFDHSPCII